MRTSGAQATDQSDAVFIAGSAEVRVERILAAFTCAAASCGLREGYAQLYFLGAEYGYHKKALQLNRPERLRAIARRLAARPK